LNLKHIKRLTLSVLFGSVITACGGSDGTPESCRTFPSVTRVGTDGNLINSSWDNQQQEYVRAHTRDLATETFSYQNLADFIAEDKAFALRRYRKMIRDFHEVRWEEENTFDTSGRLLTSETYTFDWGRLINEIRGSYQWLEHDQLGRPISGTLTERNDGVAYCSNRQVRREYDDAQRRITTHFTLTEDTEINRDHIGSDLCVDKTEDSYYDQYGLYLGNTEANAQSKNIEHLELDKVCL